MTTHEIPFNIDDNMHPGTSENEFAMFCDYLAKFMPTFLGISKVNICEETLEIRCNGAIWRKSDLKRSINRTYNNWCQ